MSGYTLARADGSFQITLPYPSRGTGRAAELIGSVRTTLGGRQVVQRVAVKRTWTLSWTRLPEAVFAPIEAFWLGAVHGPGPFLFAEPDTPAVLVNITAMPDTVDLLGFHNAGLTLVEV
ncbi:MAG TPA: hypothetical protein VIS06_01475 [Mycobacteriales bacterium]